MPKFFPIYFHHYQNIVQCITLDITSTLNPTDNFCFQKFLKLSWEITNKHTSHQGKKRPSLLQGGLKSQRFPFKCQEFMKTIWYVIWMHCFILRYILFNNRKIMQIEDKYWSFCLRINYLSSNEQVLFSNHQLYS